MYIDTVLTVLRGAVVRTFQIPPHSTQILLKTTSQIYTNQPEETTEVTLRYKKLNEQTERLNQPHEKTATLKKKEVQISKTSVFFSL